VLAFRRSVSIVGRKGLSVQSPIDSCEYVYFRSLKNGRNGFSQKLRSNEKGFAYNNHVRIMQQVIRKAVY